MICLFRQLLVLKFPSMYSILITIHFIALFTAASYLEVLIMQSTYIMKPIAHIHSDFPDKFGIPRQSGLIDSLKAEIIFEPEYRNPDAFRGLEAYSHIWLIWGFSESIRSNWSPTVRPPRLGGNTRMGAPPAHLSVQTPSDFPQSAWRPWKPILNMVQSSTSLAQT